MFTGLVQDVGRVERVRRQGAGARLVLATDLDTATFELGESVAVAGVCLTVAAWGRGSFEADVSPETLDRSTLGGLRPGGPVNLERALRPVDRLGGHFVLGHVDAVGRCVGSSVQGDFRVLRFEAPAAVLRYGVEKGSIAVDGVSLTVAALEPQGFSVAVIPHTLEKTTLPGLRVGDGVNLEADVLGKYVERLLGGRRPQGAVTWESLARSGFLR
ncbi:MAG: riboflavin synthase [Deferrisomatales bacterium]|nr:riboflavin synthase [Deferrisomatales bacterium]